MWAVLPLKDFVSAKQRLSGVLSATERRRLFHAMVEDVLSVLTQAPSIDGIVIVSDDPTAALMAKHYAVTLISEPAQAPAKLTSTTILSPLNAAINAGCEHVLQLTDDTDICILHADLPELSIAEIERLAHQRDDLSPSERRDSVILVSDRHQAGTNAMVLHSSHFLPLKVQQRHTLNRQLFHFGHNSFALHLESFAEQDLSIQRFYSPSIAADIDTPSDLMAFILGLNRSDSMESDSLSRQRSQVSSCTSEYCRDSAIAQRLQMMWMLEVEDVEHDLTEDQQNSTSLDYSQLDRPMHDQALALADDDDLVALMKQASALRDAGHGSLISYSRKVFIPLTHLCRDVCHYCTFAKTPKKVESPYLSIEEVVSIAKEGESKGCYEALFTLGDKPELRYKAARDWLKINGFKTTNEYLGACAEAVLKETSLIPHLNSGCLTSEEITELKPLSGSMGLMVESLSSKLTEKGQPHYGSPDKEPEFRMQTLIEAGKQKVPFTTGILIGIGETRLDLSLIHI